MMISLSWMTPIFALVRAIALRCKWEQPRGRRGKKPRFCLIGIKLTSVHPYPARGYIGQEILHEVQTDRSAGRWVYPENVTARGVDSGENGNDVLVYQIFGLGVN